MHPMLYSPCLQHRGIGEISWLKGGYGYPQTTDATVGQMDLQ